MLLFWTILEGEKGFFEKKNLLKIAFLAILIILGLQIDNLVKKIDYTKSS